MPVIEVQLSSHVMVTTLTEVKGGPKFMKFFGALTKDDKFYKEIDDTLELIKENPQIGNRIQYDKIPKCYIVGYNAPSLFRVEMSRGWRLIYSLTGKQGHKTVYVLEIFDHKYYEKRFGY